MTEAIVRWTIKVGTCPAGDPDLHHYIGELLQKGITLVCSCCCVAILTYLNLPEGSLEQAELHFLAAGKRDSARLLSEVLTEWLGDSPDVSKFACRGVIP